MSNPSNVFEKITKTEKKTPNFLYMPPRKNQRNAGIPAQLKKISWNGRRSRKL